MMLVCLIKYATKGFCILKKNSVIGLIEIVMRNTYPFLMQLMNGCNMSLLAIATDLLGFAI